MVELAIVFPILLILFVASAELGRLFYTYTTLAKATKVGARYLSTSRDATSTDATKVSAAKLKAKSLVVCGFTDCLNKSPVVPGLSTANVDIPNIVTVGTVKYWHVNIQDYTYQPGVFNIAVLTGRSNSAFYFTLSPGIEMRYMQ